MFLCLSGSRQQKIGSSRVGIGAALVSLYLARPSTIVIATVREITEVNKSKLHSFNQAKGSRLILVPFNLDLPSSAADDIFHLEERYGVSSLDIVIANAGICNTWNPVDKLSDNEVLVHFVAGKDLSTGNVPATIEEEIAQAFSNMNDVILHSLRQAGQLSKGDGATGWEYVVKLRTYHVGLSKMQDQARDIMVQNIKKWCPNINHCSR